jgi:hypothetical protein
VFAALKSLYPYQIGSNDDLISLFISENPKVIQLRVEVSNG